MRTKSLLLTAVATLGLTTATMAQVPNYVPTNGLVGWWPFNGNANDESGNGNNGTVNGATLTTDRFGNINSAYQFVGNDNNTISYIIANSNNLPMGNSLRTISLWVTNDSYGIPGGSGNDGHPLIAYGSPSTNSDNEILFFTSPSNVPFIKYAGFNNDLDIPFSYDLQKWYNIIATFDGTNAMLYINDSLFGSGNFSSWNTTFDSIVFGTQATKTNFHNGKIDDIRIYNRVLNQNEISSLFNESYCYQIVYDTITSNFTVYDTITINETFYDTLTTNITIYDTNYTTIYDTLTTNVTIYDTNYTTIYDTLTTNVTIYDTLTTNITVYDTIQTTIYDTLTTNITIYDTNYTTVYDTLLTTVTDTLIINTTLGLPASNTENTILIYPNPANDHITIDNGNFSAMAGYSIKITNNAGQQVFQSAINQAQFYLDLSSWTGNGLYYIHLIDPQNNTLTIRKLVLQ